MLDVTSQGLFAVSGRSPYAAALVFAAGALSSIGPCVAPRFIAAAGLTAGKTRGRAALLMLAFLGGLTLTYASFGAVSTLLGSAAHYSSHIYWIVAASLALGAFVTLWREPEQCTHIQRRGSRESAGAALLLGCSFALVVSPCCTPLIAAIVTYVSASGNAAYGCLLLACFAVGHALPVIPAAFGINWASRILERYSVKQAAMLMSGTLTLALSAYYAVLA
jgi:cytochrome c-type biogenesis protein